MEPAAAVRDAQPAEEPRWLDEDEQRAWRAYIWGTRALMVNLEQVVTERGVSLAEYELLSMLSERPDGRSRMSALADLVVQWRSRLTHTAKRLERRGWVTREPAEEDGRGVVLVLGPEGLAVIEELAPLHVESVRRFFLDVLTRSQLLALGAAMESVSAVNRA